jgi:hypothetical protein
MSTSCGLQITNNVAIMGKIANDTIKVNKLLVGAGIFQ